jgi:hypothetical protein
MLPGVSFLRMRLCENHVLVILRERSDRENPGCFTGDNTNSWIPHFVRNDL